MSKQLIGLTGYKRSGKDTAGELLIKKYDYIRYSFAGPLKKACAEIFMLNDEQMDGKDKETPDKRWGGVSARKMFQIIGTEVFREQLSSFFPEMKDINSIWIYRFKLWYQDLIKNNPNAKVVVTDVRFPNEFDIIKELGGVIIKVNRDSCKALDTHKSESFISKINPDFNVNNNGTIEEYYKKLTKIFD